MKVAVSVYLIGVVQTKKIMPAKSQMNVFAMMDLMRKFVQ